MPKRTLSPADMERHAATLGSAGSALPEERIRRLADALVATDYAGARWRVDPAGRWSFFDGDRWADATPPERLHLEEAVIAELEGIEAGGHRCSVCGAAVGANVKFCPQDGAEITRRGSSAAPARLTMASSEDDWGPALICALLGAAFAVAAHVRSSPPAYGLAAMFAILAVVMVLLNSLARRS